MNRNLQPGCDTRSTTAVFWAKTQTKPPSYHPLIAHSADVAAVMRALTGPGTAAFDRIVVASMGDETAGNAMRCVLTYLAGIHDIGKANHGFQDKAGPLAHPGTPRWVSRGHVQPLVDTLASRVHSDAWKQLLRGLPWRPEELGDMLHTAVTHHGRPVEGRHGTVRDALAALWTPDPRTGRDPLAEVDRIATAARRWAGVPSEGWASEPFPWTPTLSHMFAGLLVTADWIGSSPSIFPFRPDSEEDIDAYWTEASERAERALRQIGLRPPERRIGVTGPDIYRSAFPNVFGSGAPPTDLQLYLATAELPPPGSRIFVESDTGSGKTEAVLALYARLREAGRADGLVFALPTRATASAMRERIEACLESLHPGDVAPTVALAMGGESSQAGEAAALPIDEGDIYDEDGDRGLREWASENAKRFFAAEVVVGTVDQLLLAGLPVRHAHHRLGLLARHFIVVDELHSYDRYMSEVLRQVCDFHAAVGGTSAFLSATLSSTARHQIVGEVDPSTLEEARAAPYPAVSIRSPKRWSSHDLTGSTDPRELRWGTGSLEEGLQQATHLARRGARVCILRNTVREARATFAELEEIAADLLWRPQADARPACVHSRYIGPDRKQLDRALLHSFGKHSTATGTILVSTQIVEQSLDVDFDWMLTDLAPIDVLLQRAGRIHRHARSSRPGSPPIATLFVHAPDNGFEPRTRYRGPHGWGTVYRGLMDLELTRRTIESRGSIELPNDARSLIEGVYHAEAREQMVAEEPEWDPVEVEETGEAQAARFHGGMAALDFTCTYMGLAERFKGAENEKIRTRIGDDRLTVHLDRPVVAWHAPRGESGEVALALRQIHQADLDPGGALTAMWVEDTDQGPIFQLGRLTLRYGPTGWHW